MLQPSFWDNRETADKLVGELKYIKNIITNVNVLSNSVNSALEMIDDSDDDVRLLLEEEINELKAKIGLKCYIECIVGMLKRMDIVLLYLIGKMVKRLVLNLLCFKLMVPLLMAI